MGVGFSLKIFSVPAITFFIVFIAVELARHCATSAGFVCKVKKDRWSPRVVPMGGGVAILVGLLLCLLLIDSAAFRALAPCLILLALLGFVDDLKDLQPLSKLSVQFLAAFYAVFSGYGLPQEWGFFSQVFSVFWIVFVTNAVNLNDNMDGLSSGLVAISSAAAGFVFLRFAEGAHLAAFAFGVAATSAGFWVHNKYPARIFMGDVGSLPLGFVVSILSLCTTHFSAPWNWQAILSALLLVAVPAFDVFLVMGLRGLAGRHIILGNVDHLSHRLVRMGNSDVGSVAILHGLAFVSAVASLLTTSSLLIPSLLVVLFLFTFLAFRIVSHEIVSPFGRPISLVPSSELSGRPSHIPQKLVSNFPFASPSEVLEK